MTRLLRLWRGQMPLREALWDWGLLRGLPLNVGCTMVSLWLWLLRDSGPIAAVALTIHFLPVPFNVVMAVGVWRAASDPRHSPRERAWARSLAVALAALYMFI